MREQAGLLEHESSTAHQVVERRRAPTRGELVASDAVAKLRLVAQGEERLAAPGCSPRVRDLEHLVLAHVRRLPPPWRPRERAVPADIAAELRQRDEDLGRIGDEPSVTELAKSPGLARERSPRLGDELEGLDRGESLTHAVSLRAGGTASRRGRGPRNTPSARRGNARVSPA